MLTAGTGAARRVPPGHREARRLEKDGRKDHLHLDWPGGHVVLCHSRLWPPGLGMQGRPRIQPQAEIEGCEGGRLSGWAEAGRAAQSSLASG